VEPLLEQQAFHKDNRRVSFVSFIAFTAGIIPHEDVFDFGPIYDGIDLFHFLEAHKSSSGVNLKEVWHKNR